MRFQTIGPPALGALVSLWMTEDLQRASTHHTCGFPYTSIPS